MVGMGHAMMSTATARGENAAADAARMAINSPLLEDTKIAGSRRVLINITGSSSLGLHEVNEACSIIRDAADCDDVQINFGVSTNESMGDAVKVTVIATGFVVEAPVHVFAEAPRPTQFMSETQPTVAETVPEPDPVIVHSSEPEPEPVFFDVDDLDTPAYLRQGKLLN